MQADPPDVIDMKEYHAGNKVCFEIQFKEGFIGGMSDDVLDKYLRLTAPINLNNMVLFDTKGVLKRYPGMAEIMDDFYVVRLRQYELRKQYLVSKTRNELDLVENKIAFIEGMLRNELKLHNLKRKEMVEQLRKHRLKGIGNMTVVTSTKPKGRRVVDEPSEVEPDDFKNFDYLLGMPFWSFSEEHITKLKQEQKSLTTRLHRLEA
jgi:DNA topoisomerase-2